MLARVEGLFAFLIQAGVAGLGLSILATLAMIATRQPGRRLLLARMALGGLLCIPPLTTSGVVPPLPIVDSMRSILPPAPRVSAGSSIQQRECERPEKAAPWTTLLLGLYGAGLAWGFGSLVVSLIGVEWLKRQAEEAEPSVLQLRDELARLVGIRPPGVRFCRRVPRPILSGYLRPCIILPHVFDREANSGALRLAILHECCHLRSCDPCFSLLAFVTRTLWFPLPTVWWICAQMRLDQEFRADRLASSVFGADFSYARSLVELAEPGGASRRGGGGRALMPRVLMLVRCPFAIEPAPPLWWPMLIAPLITLATLLATSFSLGAFRAWDDPLPFSRATAHGVFQLDRLKLAADPADAQPRVFTLPALLPEEFDLSVEVETDPASLPDYRFAGCAVTLPDDIPVDPGDRWFVVRIERKDGKVRGWVDGHEVSCERRNAATRTRLRLRAPAGREVSFRTLRLAW